MNLIEKIYIQLLENEKLIQSQKDEINRLKGEDGKPTFKKKQEPKDVSSEKERQKNNDNSQRKTNRRKRNELPIHKTEIIPLDKTGLPADIEFKTHSKKIIQSIKIEPYNTCIMREIWYSKSTNQYYTASIPGEYSKGYSVELKALILELNKERKMTQPNILQFLQAHGIEISSGTISNIILESGQELASERDCIFQAGLSVSDYIQTDTTSCVENGVTKQVHVFNSSIFSVFYTKEDRKRTTIIDILRGTENRIFALNNEFFEFLSTTGVSKKHTVCLAKFKTEKLLQEDEIKKILEPFSGKKNLYSMFYELAYISGFHAESSFPLFKVLLTDNASIYDDIFLIHALCWIHEGRHFKKLNPLNVEFRNILDSFITQFWNFYHALLDYKREPSDDFALKLEKKFDSLFSKTTDYEALNERIRLTFAKKKELLVVLEHPSTPLHNNESELAVKKVVRERDISLQTKNEIGTKARDVFLSVFETAKKLGVNIYDYLVDRLSHKYELPALADLIWQNRPT